MPALDDNGFSLFELLVVCALIGIMVSLSIPSLREAFLNDPLKTTARKTIGLVNGVRELALRSQQPYFLHISRKENSLWYEADVKSGEAPSVTTRRLLLPKSIRIEGIQIAGQDIKALEQVDVWITRQGYMRETVIRFADDGGHALTLEFLPFIDTVKVTDPLAKVVQ